MDPQAKPLLKTHIYTKMCKKENRHWNNVKWQNFTLFFFFQYINVFKEATHYLVISNYLTFSCVYTLFLYTIIFVIIYLKRHTLNILLYTFSKTKWKIKTILNVYENVRYLDTGLTLWS